jgi:hypothetical protein
VRQECIKLIREDREPVTTAVCDFVSETFPCLGIIASASKDSQIVIDPDSSHGKINRPAAKDLSALPLDLCRFKNEAGESIVRNIHDGAFVALWMHTFHHDNSQHQEWMLMMASPVIYIQVYVRSEAPTSESVFDRHLATSLGLSDELQRVGNVMMTPISEDDMSLRFRRSSKFQHTTQDQTSWLSLRTYHHLLRVIGYDIGCFTLWETLAIFEQYKEREIWKDMLDASLILADILVQTKQPDTCCYFAFERVGCALELCQKHRRAAAIHGHAGHEYAAKLLDKRLLLLSYHNQGKALQRNKDFQEAEFFYLCGLRELFAIYKKQAFDQALLQLFVIEFPVIYIDRDHLGTGGALMTDLSYLLYAILKAAALLENSSHRGVTLSHILAAKYREKSAARQALLKAFKTSTVDDFRAVVRSWKQPGTQLLSSVPSEDICNHIKQFWQTESRRKIARGAAPRRKNACENPNCTA